MNTKARVQELPEKLLTAVDVAQILSVSRAFVYQLIRSGKLRAVKIQGARRVRPQDLQMFIEDNLSSTETVNFWE